MIDENEVTEEVEIEEPSDDINAELAAAWDSVESEEVESKKGRFKFLPSSFLSL